MNWEAMDIVRMEGSLKMSDDLIKRSDAIKAFCIDCRNQDKPCEHEATCKTMRILRNKKKLHSADRPSDPQEWIPCSERLPNYREVVLVSTFWGVRMAERDSIKEDGTDDFWYLFLDDATARPMYVYAWMPLPKPWKGADDE